MTMSLWKKTAAALMMAAGTFAATTAATPALAQPLDGGELYQGEQALYDAARDEGLVVSFDTGPTWANWAAQFKAFKARYPGVEIVYNDLGSAATVVALDKSRYFHVHPELVVEKAGPKGKVGTWVRLCSRCAGHQAARLVSSVRPEHVPPSHSPAGLLCVVSCSILSAYSAIWREAH